MKAKFVIPLLALTLAVSSIHAQITAERLTRRIRQDPNQPQPSQPAPGQTAPATTNAAPAQIAGYLLIKTLDTNHDFIIDANEIKNSPELLKKLDLNNDGRLTEDEYLAKDEPHPSPSPLVRALDINKDGVIDAKEIAGAPSSLRLLDKNFDGKLAPSEFKVGPGVIAKPAAAPQSGQ